MTQPVNCFTVDVAARTADKTLPPGPTLYTLRIRPGIEVEDPEDRGFIIDLGQWWDQVYNRPDPNKISFVPLRDADINSHLKQVAKQGVATLNNAIVYPLQSQRSQRTLFGFGTTDADQDYASGGYLPHALVRFNLPPGNVYVDRQPWRRDGLQVKVTEKPLDILYQSGFELPNATTGTFGRSFLLCLREGRPVQIGADYENGIDCRRLLTWHMMDETLELRVSPEAARHMGLGSTRHITPDMTTDLAYWQRECALEGGSCYQFRGLQQAASCPDDDA